MKAQHTPGPWEWFWMEEVTDGRHEAVCGVYHEKIKGHAYSIARCPKYQKQEQWEADARLISAAPDMLAALHAADIFVSHLPDDIAKDLLVVAMRDAIKKAIGTR